VIAIPLIIIGAIILVVLALLWLLFVKPIATGTVDVDPEAVEDESHGD